MTKQPSDVGAADRLIADKAAKAVLKALRTKLIAAEAELLTIVRGPPGSSYFPFTAKRDDGKYDTS